VNEHGHSLMEMVLVLAILAILAAIGLPSLRAYSIEVHLLGAGRIFKGEFLRARSMATRSNVYTAIRFERRDGSDWFSVYADGNMNGVRADDIQAGRDPRVSGPFRLDAGAPGVRVGINPGVPAIPPESGTLDPSDPIRFGPSNMVSFSPLGTATPGTFYLAGEGRLQAAVRVTGGTARVRLMVWRGRWREQS
jgi:prepilin-type N-terminal cleavage/methylation domain-containing protein